jgi:hypothetical protein
MKKPTSLPVANVVKTQREAAEALATTTKSIRAWRGLGAPGFKDDGTIDLGLLGSWVSARRQQREIPSKLKHAKMVEILRKFRLENDRIEERLIDRPWLGERMQRILGELHVMRMKSETEHPFLFGGCSDIAGCRVVLRKIWDEIMRDIQSLSKHLAE